MDTVAFHVNALTGENLADIEAPAGGVLEGKDVISGPLVDAFFVPNSAKTGKKSEKAVGGGFVVLFDEFLQVLLFSLSSTSKYHVLMKFL